MHTSTGQEVDGAVVVDYHKVSLPFRRRDLFAPYDHVHAYVPTIPFYPFIPPPIHLSIGFSAIASLQELTRRQSRPSPLHFQLAISGRGWSEVVSEARSLLAWQFIHVNEGRDIRQ